MDVPARAATSAIVVAPKPSSAKVSAAAAVIASRTRVLGTCTM